MLTFSRKTDYALIALTHMAYDRDGCSSAREIAGHYGMPLPLLMNVLKQLAQAGLAQRRPSIYVVSHYGVAATADLV